MILRYDGSSWSTAATPVERTLLTVAFAGGKEGYIVGRGGELLSLRDGRWSLSGDSPTGKTLYAIDVAANGKPWIAATSREIFKKQL